MSVDLRPFAELGRFELDWLSARHHFSFGEYYDRDRMGHGVLRVWNDDIIRPGRGFDPHPHRDFEIVTYVRRGAITHEDSMGNRGRTEAGDVQVMSAGTGVVHSEYNREDEDTWIFQIWFQTDAAGHAPRWESRAFPKADRAGVLVPLASGEAGVEEALPIHQDVTLYGATLLAATTVTHQFAAGRRGYLVPATGAVLVNGQRVEMRDGLAIADETSITIEAIEDSELLLADLP
ncbi:MAG: pirin family protein [Rhodospirillales bacterium]|nr:MAG: pirin family protein [Rhodospirillales bacterium]